MKAVESGTLTTGLASFWCCVKNAGLALATGAGSITSLLCGSRRRSNQNHHERSAQNSEQPATCSSGSMLHGSRMKVEGHRRAPPDGESSPDSYAASYPSTSSLLSNGTVGSSNGYMPSASSCSVNNSSCSSGNNNNAAVRGGPARLAYNSTAHAHGNGVIAGGVAVTLDATSSSSSAGRHGANGGGATARNHREIQKITSQVANNSIQEAHASTDQVHLPCKCRSRLPACCVLIPLTS